MSLLPLTTILLAPAGETRAADTPANAAPVAAVAAGSLSAFEAKAGQFHALVALPRFETTPAEVKATVDATIRAGNAALDQIAALDPKAATFANTAGALDDIRFDIASTLNRFALIKETSPDATLRDATTDTLKTLQEWAVGLDYREDVYRVLKTYADTKPALQGEDAKLLSETVRDYRRAGLDLARPQRDEVERLRKELSRLSTDFDSNINKARKVVPFTAAELEGVPAEFLDQVKGSNNTYNVEANVTWHYLMVMENANREDTRRRLEFERENLARNENLPLLEKIIPLRDDIAHRLGYTTWADYQTEIKMAKNASTAIDFVQKLKKGLQPKFDAELAEFRQLKAKETGNPQAKIQTWDWRYYANQLQKQKYNVDAEQLRVYFPYQRVLDGMFSIYQRIFGLKFEAVEAPYKWVPDLQLYAVSDAQTGEPLGLFYLDMFPREGKFNHFAVFGVSDGKLRRDGVYQRPVVSLVCNFPSPAGGRPSLLSHSDVETLFHEFGHAMHGILTRAKFSRFAGGNVPGDFVEAPSQMLEHWVWDKGVLDSFAGDYRDPSKKIPAEILAKLKESKLALEGTRYRRQLAFGTVDLMLHTRIHQKNAREILPLSNQLLGEVFLAAPADTAFVAYFGHLMGYDAGYYGYAWADAIAADMATVFEKSRDGYLDVDAGRKLRKEIYEVGDSRDVNISIERFLGRKRSLQPFLEQIGIKPAKGSAARS